MTLELTQLQRDKAFSRRVAAGDQAAFEEFFREYFPRLYRFTLARVNNDEALAEEIVQRTMCIIVQKMGSYRGEALLFTWLCQICRNERSAVFRRQDTSDLRRKYWRTRGRVCQKPGIVCQQSRC